MLRFTLMVWMVALFCSTTPAFADCALKHVHLEGPWGTVKFDVRVADTPHERAQGLMFVQTLPRMQGMLFVFEDEKPVQFWMKNTLIALDILFFDAQGQLVSIARQAVPGDLTSLPSGGPTKYVLEINGGLSNRLGIIDDTRIMHKVLEKYC